jgi:hypothetical protein
VINEQPLFRFAVAIPLQSDSAGAGIRAARRFALEAEIEFNRGREAKALAEALEDESFLKIAVWHFARCAEKARRAETNFLFAQKSQTRLTRRNYCRVKAGEMAKFIARAEQFNKFQIK